MGKGFIWSTLRFCAWCYIIKYLLSDFFFCHERNYVDYNIVYDAGDTIEDVISSLQESPEKLF